MTPKMWKRVCSLLLAVLMAATLLPVSVLAAGTEGYSDVDSGDSCFEAVTYLRNHGYMVGTGRSSFSPNVSLSRGMAAVILHRLAGKPEVSGSTDFSDFVAGRYDSDAIVWAIQNGIFTGNPDGPLQEILLGGHQCRRAVPVPDLRLLDALSAGRSECQ
jgi:hypothetical protein